MEQPICAVFDKKSGLFDNPFNCRHIAEAVRQFDIVRKDPENKYGKNPEDFELMKIGTWNYATGTFENQKHETLTSGV